MLICVYTNMPLERFGGSLHIGIIFYLRNIFKYAGDVGDTDRKWMKLEIIILSDVTYTQK